MGVDFDLASALTLRADLFGDDPALIQGDMVISWAGLEDQSARLAGFLAAHGVGPGDRVAIGTTNRPEYLITLLAAVKLRAVAVNVNFRYRAGELGQVLAASRSVVLVHDSALAAAVPAGRAAAPLVRLVLSAERESAALADSTEFAEALQTAPRPRPAPDPGAQWLLFTGGTTGLPKAVVQPQRRVVRDLSGLGFGLLGAEAPEEPGEAVRVLRERHAGRPMVLTGPPLMHATGLYFTLGGLLAGGAAVLLAGRRFDPAELLAAVGRHRVTDVVMVGDAFALPIADELDRAAAAGRRYQLSSLRAMRSVGASWSPAVKRRLLAHADITLSDTLSATEGGPFALSVSDRRTPDAELGAFRLAPGARLLPVDAAGDVPGEAVGVLAAPAPPGVHYEDDPERTAQTFREVDGVLYTVPGDLAALNPDGTLRLLGRGSGVINTGGEKVYAGEVEEALRGYPGVDDAIVIGVPDPRWGSAVAAVVAAAGPTPDPGELRAHVAAVLADYKKPRQVAVVAQLRRTATGKADLRWARDLITGKETP